MTISSTWWGPNQFEESLLQKPIFGLFLSIFHLFSLTDLQHILIVKAAFCIIGLFGLYFFLKLALDISKHKNKSEGVFFVSIMLLLLSPTILNNFFRIRTDQVSFLLFSLFLYFNHNKKNIKSLLALLLLPLVGAKEAIFLFPGLFMYCYKNEKLLKYLNSLSTFFKFNLFLAFLAFVIWLINSNMQSIQYLQLTYEKFEFPNFYFKQFIRTDFILLFFSTITIFITFIKGNSQLKPYAINSLLILVLLVVIPQSYSYYIASLVPFFYLPFIVYLIELKEKIIKKCILMLLAIINISSLLFYEHSFIYNTNISQLKYVHSISVLLDKYSLNYLDGMGVFPRQKFITCFISPNDNASNYNCVDRMKRAEPDIIILTGRLASYTGIDISEYTNERYDPAAPFLFLSKKVNNKSLLDSFGKHENLGFPPLLFGFN
jgi:hypothetical protein